MTLSEKIFAAHDVERRGVLKPGDVIRVDVDFVMASEISWAVSWKYFVLYLMNWGEEIC